MLVARNHQLSQGAVYDACLVFMMLQGINIPWLVVGWVTHYLVIIRTYLHGRSGKGLGLAGRSQAECDHGVSSVCCMLEPEVAPTAYWVALPPLAFHFDVDYFSVEGRSQVLFVQDIPEYRPVQGVPPYWRVELCN
jgi:hypothetical protein